MKSLYLNIDNQTLVRECRNGDRDAMSILYTRFAPRMLRVISRYVTDKDSAHDILHDGFVAAFTRLDTLRDPERLEFWLATIMKNLSLKFLQAQSITSILDEIPETLDDPEPLDILDFATLELLISKLPDGYQQVFRLAVLEGKSHKEISEILGIAPNSSSSQLFHAKLRLRQLIKDYQLRTGLISFLLVFVSVGVLFFGRHAGYLHPSGNIAAYHAPDSSSAIPLKPSASVRENSPSLPVKSSSASIPGHPHAISCPSDSVRSNPSNHVDSIAPHVSDAESIATSDTVSSFTAPERKLPTDTPHGDEAQDSFYDRLLTEAPRKSSAYRGWSTGIAVDPGFYSFNGIGNDGLYDSSTILPPDQTVTEPDDEGHDPSAPSRVVHLNANDIENYLGSATRRHYLPISFSLTAEKRFSSWLGVESGIGYSYLHTDYERYNATEHKNDVSTCHWHYLEVPLKVNLYAYSAPRFSLYFSLGGRVAMPVYSYASIAHNPYCQSGRFDSKAVWSVGGSVGVAFRLSKRVDLFIEPSLRYHFPQDSRLPNIWTDDEPFSLSIPLGFRLSW